MTASVRRQGPQADVVLTVLSDDAWHSTLEFVELGILRAAARVHELRRAGFAIECRRRPRSRAVFEYRLAASEAEVLKALETEFEGAAWAE